jgi:RND family efflux transporter MFP subunit
MKIRNRISYFSLAVILALTSSCSSDGGDKKELLNKYKAELAELTSKIEQLETEISEESGEELAELDLIGVNVKKMTPETFVNTFEINGNVTSDQNIIVSSEAAGQLKKIFVKEGDKVNQGDVIAVLNTSVLEKNLDELENSYVLVNQLYERQERLWQQKIGSEIQYLQSKTEKEGLEKKIKSVKAQLALSTVTASINGVIETIFVKEGEMVGPGAPVVQLVNNNKLKISADVTESALKNVKKGDLVSVAFPALGVDFFTAPITRVGSTINPQNRTFKVEILLDNNNDILKPNAMAVLRISDFKTDSALVVPSTVINQDSKGNYVFIVKEKNDSKIVFKHYITVGKNNNGQTQILKGLDAGDEVVTAGNNQIVDGMKVKVKN